MTNVYIQCGKQKFEIINEEIIELELKLNLCPYGCSWKEIGLALYTFYINPDLTKTSLNLINVTEFQYSYLNELHHKTYEEVYQESIKKY